MIEGPKQPIGPIYIHGLYDPSGVWVVLLGGDFEAFVDSKGRTTAFRRRGVIRRLKGSEYFASAGGVKELPPAEFKSALTSELALAVRRCIVKEDVIARSSVLMGIINKAMSELEDLRDANMSQSSLRQEIETIRMRIFSRLMAADLRKGPPLER